MAKAKNNLEWFDFGIKDSSWMLPISSELVNRYHSEADEDPFMQLLYVAEVAFAAQAMHPEVYSDSIIAKILERHIESNETAEFCIESWLSHDRNNYGYSSKDECETVATVKRIAEVMISVNPSVFSYPEKIEEKLL